MTRTARARRTDALPDEHGGMNERRIQIEIRQALDRETRVVTDTQIVLWLDDGSEYSLELADAERLYHELGRTLNTLAEEAGP
jgi:hypothetical protein